MMRTIAFIIGSVVLSCSTPANAGPRVICTIAREIGSAEPLVQEGDCDERISSASTFKIATSLMGFDSGILTASDQPEWQFQEGYTDWNPAWREATTPERWMRRSGVWSSKELTRLSYSPSLGQFRG